ncbi:glycerol-3-phosphate responsive antiterminator [Listeria sp. FSL L7-1582]|uniref:glycerol-3-phosphate responsive antiterminator n=1 Tax=Listeria portnoyi TaxID=2713504 RepID=UPI00164E77A0|nr:glycerol-3-phosphate responsive antiterminator [Listeria portnoyi]MBC6308034.1 glycerol-3-phosphate responsive antiterminator [Listeria portnoyi]
MSFNGQTVIPAAHNHRDVEKILSLDAEYMVMLETQVGQLKSLVNLAASGGKKVILHADLIHGLKNDEYAVDFLCQDVRPAGIISTRGNVILKAKQHKVLAIQRLFMLDSSAFTKSTALVQKTKPDYIELLPGILPTMVEQMTEQFNIPVIAGGLITTQAQVDEILAAKATAITTSQKSLWK